MKPLVTFAVFSYCDEKYISESINSVLEQNYENLEIVISDDHSSDNSYGIIKNIFLNYKGPHKLILNRNKRNLGLPGNWNIVNAMAKGSIIIVASGDDISYPNRVLNTVEAFNRYPNAKIVTGKHDLIDMYGKSIPYQNYDDREIEFSLNDFLKKSMPSVNAATRGYKAEVFKTFGNLDENGNTEDSPSLLRSLYLGTGVYIPKLLISYRKHPTSLSSSNNLNEPYLILNKQFKTDLNLAKRAKLIKSEISDVEDWIDLRCKRDFIRNKYLKSKNKIIPFFRLILLSKHFQINDKLNMFKKIIASYVKND